MDFLLIPFANLRRRRWLLVAATFALSSYGAYKIYHLPAVSRRRRKLSHLLAALSAATDAAASSAEAASLLFSDLTVFLKSDSDDLPCSLKQVSKIARSDEFTTSLSKIFEALTVGIARGLQSGESVSGSPVSYTRKSTGFSDRLMDKLFSAAGSGFTSVVAGSFARGLVMGFYTSEPNDRPSNSPEVPQWVQLVFRDESQELIKNCVELFVRTAVTVYLDKTMDINTFDEFFSGLTNPKHEAKMKEVLVSVCNGAVETLVKTSHEVITSPNSSSPENRAIPNGEKDSSVDHARGSSFGHAVEDGGGWVDQIASSLAVPSNRKFVLDVTGRITFETVRSFLDFVLWKIQGGTKRGANTVKEELIERGLEVVRYFSAKSIVIITVCLSLCMHIFLQMPLSIPS
ncbi:protein PHLOEM protein 2-LIKE A10-like [Canna indica]|uniref:Protein PHLOEM protein 2-LIKE A10-like n=1 Tax=Canna indica TaxID=4628 RepID=A0AAQ3JUF7_9LILI|nr:protein PHLOEM protein 2-LIKE A10-like [Canna indica]